MNQERNFPASKAGSRLRKRKRRRPVDIGQWDVPIEFGQPSRRIRPFDSYFYIDRVREAFRNPGSRPTRKIKLRSSNRRRRKNVPPGRDILSAWRPRTGPDNKFRGCSLSINYRDPVLSFDAVPPCTGKRREILVPLINCRDPAARSLWPRKTTRPRG